MLILASQSPRRAELLNQIGVSFSQCSVDIDETPNANETPIHYVERMALEKSVKGSKMHDVDDWVVGADTIVVAEQQILGKPKDQADSHRMLNLLSDNTHHVFTAVSVTQAQRQKTILVETQVCFGALSQEQIEWYWQTGEPKDKAGSYGIQGLGGQFVKHIKGSYSAVVGLPLFQTRELLAELGAIHEC